MACLYYTALRRDSSRLVGAWSPSKLVAPSVQWLVGLTLLLAVSVSLVHAQTGQVSLAWDAPTTHTDGTPATDLAGYVLYWQDSTGVTQRVNVGNQTTYLLTGLVGGTTYTVDITAYDTAGHESSPSNTLTVPVPLAQPDTATTPVGTSVSI